METASAQVDDVAFYLYGLVRPPVNVSDLAAIEEGAQVLVVEADGIACALSPVAPAAYRHLPDAHDRQAQLAWLAPRALRHHEVLRRLHAATAVVPLKFGTVCASVDHVGAMLHRLRDPIAQLLDRFSGKDEWTLKLSIDHTALTALVQSEDAEFARLCAQARELSDGRAFFARKRLERRTADRVATHTALIERDVQRAIEELSIEMAPVQHASSFTAALLVPRECFDDLEASLAALECTHAGAHAAFELSGPWAPYTFARALEAESLPPVRE